MAIPLARLDRDSVEPLYRQLRRAIEYAVTNGLVDTTQPLPSSRQLAADFAVSRNTANLAYQELVAEGIVTARPRRGLFVNESVSAVLQAGDREGSTGIDWSSRMRTFADSDLPQIEKVLDWNTYPYPFLAGQVDPQTFPMRGWLRALRESMYHPHVYPALQDSLGADDPLLVDVIRRQLLPPRGIEARPEEILVTVGSQHGLNLVARLLLNDRSTVAMEQPGYPDARHIFARAGVRFADLPVDGDGAVPPDDLTGIDLAHLTPSHQSPTNVTLSMERRIRLVHMASEAGTILVEDDYDSEFRYAGRPSPALKALDRTGDVIYLGTFSKFLSPGLRLGYVVAHPDLVRELRQMRRYELRHPPGQLQRAMALFIDNGDYHRALRRHRDRLQHKWISMTEAVAENFPFEVGPFPPGGVSLWIEGPKGLDGREVAARAQEQGVLIEQGALFFHPSRRRHQRYLRLGYSAIPQRSITEGIRRLGVVLRDHLG
ncbi:PLP-dependent aminotransferase family protein [Calidifontibacter sp. DB0510]|uniref:PLP-dependent aminotransferase family protein n=1 Tax=Metallococcus carri TaxID=1656884 RepID=A0A967EHN9_9MICO|nr:PLP-dependent aminotransferase family protein [Metallococcus carri]NHN56703.1 PLP-dependent aminotransferase family protein [Metallococcus carri]NOP37920.1 PLP-dependent aminotransferase family protein [Calidifontibacter sp. DB2511S]